MVEEFKLDSWLLCNATRDFMLGFSVHTGGSAFTMMFDLGLTMMNNFEVIKLKLKCSIKTVAHIPYPIDAYRKNV